LLEAVVRRREDRAPPDIGRDSQWAQVIAMLKADEFVVARHFGQCSEQMASILWYAALPVGIQAGIDRNTHKAFCGRITVERVAGRDVAIGGAAGQRGRVLP